MTREEARREIDSLDFYLQNHTDDYGEESHTAMMIAIKALEQEPCEDAVSRAELLKLYENRFIELQKAHQMDKQLGINWCINTLNDLQSVTLTHIETVTEFADRCIECGNRFGRLLKRTRWIPVSERLPEVGEKVLRQCQANIYEVLKLTVDGWYHDQNHCYMESFVIAWMSLPEPYKAEMESEE